MSDASTWNCFLKFLIVVWLQPWSPLSQVCALTTRSFLNFSTVNKVKLYRYWKASFQYLWTNTESILDHQQRVHPLGRIISYHAISTGSFFSKFTFLCNGLLFQHWVKWPWTWSSGAVLCIYSLNMSLSVLSSDIWFSLICSQNYRILSWWILSWKLFTCIVKRSKHIVWNQT